MYTSQKESPVLGAESIRHPLRWERRILRPSMNHRMKTGSSPRQMSRQIMPIFFAKTAAINAAT